MIFSLLKLRKKTSAVLSSILIAVGCLWGIAWWQDLTARQLLDLFLGSLLMIVGTMALAIALVAIAKALHYLLSRNRKSGD